MNKFNASNLFRRKLMRRIARNIGDSKIKPNTKPLNREDVKRVLISRPNHRLGNLLLITPLVQEVSNTFPNSQIDLFVKGNLGSIVFKNYEKIDKIIILPKKHFKQLHKYLGGWLSVKRRKYDLVINVVYNSSSGRLSTKFADATYKFYGGEDNSNNLGYPDYGHIAKSPVYNFRNYLSQLNFQFNQENVPPVDIKLSTSELTEGKIILENLIQKGKKTICLFTYATGDKCYSPEWWLEFYENLKTEFPDCNIVEVLPFENVSQISFKEPTFYSQNIREIGAFIANTDIFIGADSGIMHLANSAGTPVLGLFSVTPPETYGPYGAESIGINTNQKNTAQIVEEMKKILD